MIRLWLPLFRSLLLAGGLFAAGCAATSTGGPGTNPVLPESTNTAVLRSGDTLRVALQGVPDASSQEVLIDEQGLISMPFIGSIRAAGLTTAELSQTLRETYIARKIYNSVNAAVNVTERFIYVGGEVANPGRIVWTTDLTAVKAVQAAGGFSLYAKETAVILTREGKAYTLDIKLAQRNPGEDRRLMPGDSLQVARSPF